LRRAALFFFITFFSAALSSAFCAFRYHSFAPATSALAMASRVPFTALLTTPLMERFRSVFLAVTRMYFLADFLIGITVNQKLKFKRQNQKRLKKGRTIET
jgi:hypothetical protein